MGEAACPAVARKREGGLSPAQAGDPVTPLRCETQSRGSKTAGHSGAPAAGGRTRNPEGNSGSPLASESATQDVIPIILIIDEA